MKDILPCLYLYSNGTDNAISILHILIIKICRMFRNYRQVGQFINSVIVKTLSLYPFLSITFSSFHISTDSMSLRDNSRKPLVRYVVGYKKINGLILFS